MLVDATHSRLEDREEAFDGIGVGHALAVLAFGMVDVPVPFEFLADALVVASLVGREDAITVGIGYGDFANTLGAECGGMD